MLEAWRKSLARWIAPGKPKIGTRTYAGARNSRLTSGFGTYSNSSADSELSSGLTALRSRSRQLMRDSPYAKRARMIVVNNVIGSGIGMQAQVKNTRNGQNTRINDEIESAWEEWCRADSCHTGGALHFADLERAALSEIFTAGEVFIRKHYRTFGDSDVPFALELIEAERVADEYTYPQAGNSATRLGVEIDPFGRPVAYYIRVIHPGEVRFTPDKAQQFERVPASDIIHLRRIERWPQTRGEPWLHCVLRKLNDMEEYSGAELTAARMGANFFATIESEANDPNPLAAEEQPNGTKELNIEPGVIEQLDAGDQLKFHAPNRPNQGLDPFLRYMLREVAAGVGVSYESLSRDYSQSNYSSSRLALLDDRDLWRSLQQWFIRSFREPLHREWLQQAVMARAISDIPLESYVADRDKFSTASFKPRGWSWVDPTKEVEAFKEARKAGFISTSRIIANTADGADVEDIIEEIKRDDAAFAAAGINVDTAVPDEPAQPGAKPEPAAPANETPNDSAPNRIYRVRGAP